jgi:hypothetical protein
MAKKAVNKSQAIRDTLATGVESPTEVAKILAEKGITVHPSAVSVIKGKMKKGKRATAAKHSALPSDHGMVSVAALKLFLDAADELGRPLAKKLLG